MGFKNFAFNCMGCWEVFDKKSRPAFWEIPGTVRSPCNDLVTQLLMNVAQMLGRLLS